MSDPVMTRSQFVTGQDGVLLLGDICRDAEHPWPKNEHLKSRSVFGMVVPGRGVVCNEVVFIWITSTWFCLNEACRIMLLWFVKGERHTCWCVCDFEVDRGVHPETIVKQTNNCPSFIYGSCLYTVHTRLVLSASLDSVYRVRICIICCKCQSNFFLPSVHERIRPAVSRLKDSSFCPPH